VTGERDERTAAEIRLQALSYVLLATLQRLDAGQPGFVADLLDGVRADRAAALQHTGHAPDAAATFAHAIGFLERANARNGG